MNSGTSVFSQVMGFGSRFMLDRCIKRYGGNRRVRSFTCREQYLAMSFAQLTYRESLRDIEACLRAVPDKLYHMGFKRLVSRSTLADANESRDWRIYADYAQRLIARARRLYVDEPLGVDLDQTVYALDSTTIDLCLSLFPWSRFPRRSRGAIKVHTLLDLRGSIPAYAWITNARMHDVRILDVLVPEPGSLYVMDRGYIDFARLCRLEHARATFVIRAKKNLAYRRIYSHEVDRHSGLICDQTIRLTNPLSREAYQRPLRRVRFKDPKTAKTIVLLTNDFDLPALTVCDIYRLRWQVELFFKWIKQHLRIKAFFGTSENAVKTQIWIAISVYTLVAIARKELGVEHDLYTILQILSVHAFEQVPLSQLLTGAVCGPTFDLDPNQLRLFDL